MPKMEKVIVENAHLIFRNFEGKEGPYNRKGDRNFSILLDQDVAAAMYEDGWNVKVLKKREGQEDEPEQPYISVSVNFRNRPPKVYMITSRGRTPLGEEQVEMLDYSDIRTADVIINPYSWDVNGKTGIKAYLGSLFVTIEEDELDLKYSDIQDAPTRTGRSED